MFSDIKLRNYFAIGSLVVVLFWRDLMHLSKRV